jgi:predicted dithiol-disulfide oxidoreductase (DUF899 family)
VVRSAPRLGIDAKISRFETAISELKEKLAKLRRSLPRVPVKNYVFKGTSPRESDLASLFGDKKDLIVVHHMGLGCPYCHIESRAAFVVESPDAPEKQQQFALQRGWKFRMVSSGGTKFKADMGVAQGDDLTPGFSMFHKADDGTITRVAQANFGPGDDYCSVFHFFGLLADGGAGWGPELSYESRRP